MARSKHDALLRLTGVAIFSAIAYILTAFCLIPYPGGGYLNFGDVVTLFVSMIYGPIEGALVGVLAGSMGDLTAGYAVYIPFTIVAKGLMGLATGFVFNALKKRERIRFVSPFIGATLMIAVYMGAYALIIGKGLYLATAFDCVQGYGMALLSVPLVAVFEKTGLSKSLHRDRG